MEILNAPSRETFCVQRDRTNTPLQALVLLNDPQFIEASRTLAARAFGSADDFDSRLDSITLRLINRRLDDTERKVVADSFNQMIDHYRRDPDEANKLLAVGESKPPDTADPAELAAWTLVASQILNLDETLTR
jgi:hypothetical protein